MKHHIVEPAGKTSKTEPKRPQRPEKMKPIAEDAVTGRRDMSVEQQAAFVSPAHEERRVLDSQGDQGRQ